jgi:hypothetical protein
MVLKLEFYGKIFEKYAISHVMQIRQVGDEFFFEKTDGQTDMTKLTARFSQFCERNQIYNLLYEISLTFTYIDTMRVIIKQLLYFIEAYTIKHFLFKVVIAIWAPKLIFKF